MSAVSATAVCCACTFAAASESNSADAPQANHALLRNALGRDSVSGATGAAKDKTRERAIAIDIGTFERNFSRDSGGGRVRNKPLVMTRAGVSRFNP